MYILHDNPDETSEQPSVTATQTKDQVKGGLLLNVVVREGTSILELLSSEDKTLLIRGDSLLILNFGLYRLNGVRGLDLKSDGLSCESLDKNL